MHRLIFAAMSLPMLLVGCSTVPTREPVLPEPSFVQINSPECHAVWERGVEDPKIKFEPRPYGWAIVRYDVEHGEVINVEILDGSPRKIIEAPTLAYFRGMRFPSLRSARGCLIRHQW